MSLAPSDQNHLILPLFEGIFETPLWGQFLTGLQRRTGAQRICALLGNIGVSAAPLCLRHLSRDSAPVPEARDRQALDALSMASLRPNRIYALDELLDFDDSTHRTQQDGLLGAASIGDGRFMRVVGRSGATMVLALLHGRRVFEAADSAVLAALAPAIASALDLHDRVMRLQMRTVAAEDALGLLGIGQAVLDAEGGLIVHDPLAPAIAPALFGAEAQRRGADDGLRQACHALTGGDRATRRIIPTDTSGTRQALLRTMPRPPGTDMPRAAAIVSVRIARIGEARSAARTLQAGTDLSVKEAELALAISRGQSVADAADALNLTLETARNYTKRIYSKLALTGQADLTRYVLSSLAPLA